MIGGQSMIEAILCYLAIGILIAIVFSLLFITFDESAKKIILSLFSFGGSTSFGIQVGNYFEINSPKMKCICMFSLYMSFIITFLISMYIVCLLIKDKNNPDALRIRDIILNQKKYINTYFENRCKYIDTTLNIENLKKREEEVSNREKEVSNREKIVSDKEVYIEQELEKITQLGNKKLKLQLPEKSNIVITDKFLKTMPSYIRDLSKCINAIEKFTEQYLDENEDIDMLQLNSYLTAICLSISEYIFGGGSQDVRIHFRKFDNQTNAYEKMIVIIGNKLTNRKMTSIPYNNSMIERSDICKRALIKSINSKYDFSSNNNTIWKDYMTFALYGLRHNDIPIFSFGISVKNEERFKELFYFLNFFRIEECLEENLEKINDAFDIESIIYK